jgi:hypothetical protein
VRRTLNDRLVSDRLRSPHVGGRFLRPFGDRRVVGFVIGGFAICGLGLHGLEASLRARFVKGRHEGVLWGSDLCPCTLGLHGVLIVFVVLSGGPLLVRALDIRSDLFSEHLRIAALDRRIVR